MAVFERSTLIPAPLGEVWAFHATVDGLLAVSPDWLRLRVESVVGPDGEPDPDVLETGSEVTLSVRPAGVGPRSTWTSRIVRRERGDDAAMFADEMVAGPFRRWHHTHRFATVAGETRLTDRVEYELPLGPARRLSGLVWPGLAAMFAARHRRTKRRLE